MKQDQVKKAAELLEELNELKKYKSLFENKNSGKATHYELVQHYGTLLDYDRVQINQRHSDRFTSLLETIISEIEKEIEEI